MLWYVVQGIRTKRMLCSSCVGFLTRQRCAGADADDGGMGGSEDASPEDGDGDGSEDEMPPSGIRRKTGHGTTGKPGKRLTLEDLQAHFGVSLQVSAPRTACPCFGQRAAPQYSSAC